MVPKTAVIVAAAEDEGGEDTTRPIKLLQQGCPELLNTAQHLRDAPNLRIAGGFNHQPQRRALDHNGAGKGHGGAFGQNRVAGCFVGGFVDGVDSPVSAASCVRKRVAWIRRRSAGTRSPLSTMTMSPGTSSSAGMLRRAPSRTTLARGEHVADALQRLFCLTFLYESNQGNDDHDADNRAGIHVMTEPPRLATAATMRDDHQNVVELLKQALPPGAVAGAGDLVGAIPGKALVTFLGGKAVLGGVQSGQRFIRGQGMPGVLGEAAVTGVVSLIGYWVAVVY